MSLSNYALHGNRMYSSDGVLLTLYRVKRNDPRAMKIQMLSDILEMSHCSLCLERISNPLDHEHDPASNKFNGIAKRFIKQSMGYLPEDTPCIVIIMPHASFEALEIWKESRRVRVAKRHFIEHNAADAFTQDHVAPMLQAQEGRCYYCGKLLASDNLSAQVHHDHMVPIVYGGTHDVANIVLACRTCNLDKGSMLYADFGDKIAKQLTAEQRKIVRRIQKSVGHWKASRMLDF